jgi:tetratricopeptide (TPR) repeat protein
MPVLSPSRTITIFLSYDITSSEDSEMFDQLSRHLSLLRRQYPAHEWYDSNPSAGSEIDQVVAARLNIADLIILLVSADFFASDRCYNLEMRIALDRAAAGTARLVVVCLRPSEWNFTPLGHYKALPSNGNPISLFRHRESAFNEIAQEIRQIIEELASQEAPHATSAPPHASIRHLPYDGNDFFTNRADVLAALSSSFDSARPHRTSIVALSGLGGIGKTQVALEYTLSSLGRQQDILWINASSRAALNAQLSSIAGHLMIPQKDREDEQRLFAAFKLWLQNRQNWLLVLDQIEEMTLVDLIVPRYSDGQVLLTTRKQATGRRGNIISIASMDTDASILLLLHRAKILPAQATLDQAPAHIVRDATAIVEELRGFPLALDQAGAYIEEKGCSLATYLTLYREQQVTLLSERGRLADDHHESVMHTLMLAIKEVAAKNAANLELLRLLAFLHPDAIPEGMLTNGAQELSEPLRTLVTDTLAFYQALDDLRSYSLIQKGADRSILVIHRIVQDVLIAMLPAAQQRHQARLAVRVVNCAFPNVSFESWADCERYLPQAQRCAALISKYRLTLKEGALLMERLGVYCTRRASYTEAETYLLQSLRLYERHLHMDSPDAAQTLNSLGLLYYRQMRYQEAEEYHQRALKLRERVLGTEHPKTAESLHNLAMVYGELENYQQAEQLYQRALAIEEHAKGPGHPDIAITLNNLGLIYSQQGHYAQAETAYRRALGIYERSLSPDHPELAYTLNNLGALAEKTGSYQRAEEFYQRALIIREKIYGEKHPDVALSLNKLAGIVEAQGDYQQAEVLYRRALSIDEEILGPEHRDVALILNDLAFLAKKQGQYQKAEDGFQRALSIYEKALGTEHSTVASVLNNLGELYGEIGDEEHAEKLLRRALRIREKVLGATHPYIAQSLSSLADLLIRQHRNEEAKPMLQRALEIRLQIFGPEHPLVTLTKEKYESL